MFQINGNLDLTDTRPTTVTDIIEERVDWNIGHCPIFQVNLEFQVVPDVLGIPRHEWVVHNNLG